MMRQYLAIKAQHPDAILFYRMGDFYEMFLRDAEIAAPLLDIALTTRDSGKPDAVPMCGVPVHAVDAYIQRLAELGHRVAICEQVEDARADGRSPAGAARGGRGGDAGAGRRSRLGSTPAQELVLVALLPGPVFGLAVLDARTGDLRATEVGAAPGGGAARARSRRSCCGSSRASCSARRRRRRRSPRRSRACCPDAARTRSRRRSFEPARAPAIPHGLRAGRDRTPARARPRRCSRSWRRTSPSRWRRSRGCAATASPTRCCSTRRRARTSSSSATARTARAARTLIERIDRTATPLGARRLARWLAYPLLDPAAIAERQRAVAWLAERDRPRARLREALRPVRDLERALAKTARPSATPRDLAALRGSLEALPGVAEALASGDEDALADGAARRGRRCCASPRRCRSWRGRCARRSSTIRRRSRAARAARCETGYLREGFHAELDALREAGAQGARVDRGLEAAERERTGIGSLKIRFHPVHGYGIEISQGAARARFPADYERKQTLASAERFTTPGCARSSRA